MDEVGRLHKDVPFGWFALLQAILARRSRPISEVRTSRTPPVSGTLPGDLHHLAGPH